MARRSLTRNGKKLNPGATNPGGRFAKNLIPLPDVEKRTTNVAQSVALAKADVYQEWAEWRCGYCSKGKFPELRNGIFVHGQDFGMFECSTSWLWKKIIALRGMGTIHK